MDSRLRGNDGERFARMAGIHDCVVIDLSLSFPRRRESIGHHSDTRWVLFLNQPNLPYLGPFFRRIYLFYCLEESLIKSSASRL